MASEASRPVHVKNVLAMAQRNVYFSSRVVVVVVLVREVVDDVDARMLAAALVSARR